MGEGVLKAMMIIALGMVAGAGLAGGLTGGLLGGIVTMGTGAPVSITAPIGAVIGAGTAGTLTYRRIWYGKRRKNPPVDDQV